MQRTEPTVTLIPGDEPDHDGAALDRLVRVMLLLVDIPGGSPTLVAVEHQEAQDNGDRTNELAAYREQVERRRARK